MITYWLLGWSMVLFPLSRTVLTCANINSWLGHKPTTVMRWAARDMKASIVGEREGPTPRPIWAGAAPPPPVEEPGSRRSPLRGATRRRWGRQRSGVKAAKWRRLRAEAEEPLPCRPSSYRCTSTRALDASRRRSSTPGSQGRRLEARYHTTGLLLLFRGYALTCLLTSDAVGSMNI